MTTKTMRQLEKMSDVEIVDYALIMNHKDGSKESEYVYERLTNGFTVPTRGVDTSVQD